jgi:hypothetical protein
LPSKSIKANLARTWHLGGIDAGGDAGNTMTHPVKMIRKRDLTEERLAPHAIGALSTFMNDGMPDPAQFLDLFGNLIMRAVEAAKGEQARVAVFGECVHLLCAQGNAEAAIQVEKLGNQLTKTYDLDTLCGYSVSSVQGGMGSRIFQRICAEHSGVHSR